MPADPYNVRERLRNAVRILATGITPIRSRLEGAAMEIAFLRPDDFVDPKGYAMVTAIRERFSAIEDAERGSIAATAAGMSDDQAQATAREILDPDRHYRSGD